MARFSTLEDIFACFEGRANQVSNLVLCPAHKDNKPSLSITQEGNKAVLHCHAGCKTEDILKIKGWDFADLNLNDKELKGQVPDIPAPLEKKGMSKPIAIQIPDGWEFALEEHEALPVIKLRHIHRNRAGDIIAELSAFCMLPNIMIPVTGIRFNLSSLQAHKQISDRLQENCDDASIDCIDWRRIIADICLQAIKKFREGDKVEDIWPSDKILKPGYLIEPILPLNQPTIIFGDGASGKGHIAVTVSVIAQLPYKDNGLGLITQDEPSNVLYLDYENDRADFERTLTGICKGLGINVGLKRLEMAQPIADTIEQLRIKVRDEEIGFLIVDSLALASGGNVNEAEPAIRIYSALRTLPDVTTLIIAHNAKDSITNKKSVYGSVFFTNLARSVWEVKKSQEPDDTEMLVSLKHRKSNRKLHSALGFRFSFNDANNTIGIEKAELKDTELSSELALSSQIKDLLRGGAMTAKAISETLEASENSVRRSINRMAQREHLVKVDNAWGLALLP